ncbi:hypothetical protein WG66_015838 [Moniliophthora roreri]|uniref:Uncharacterized protein n=1 Tax=Moniliophthora roreri TaxID=221103 RepID=A0A0W0F1J4_MONRR|nr:hypothetical protein WG66_015838 [Moniliophthora roreri]
MSSRSRTPAHSRRSSLLTIPTQTSFSFLTNSDESTASEDLEGPGAVSGHYIKALGELTLKGFEGFVVYRRLLNIKKRFPHSDEEIVPHGMYDGLLELCRPGLYSRQLRRQALRILITQIARRETAQLLKRLIRWPLEQLRAVLVEFTSCLHDQWQDVSHPQPTYRDLVRIYISVTRDSEPHPILPFLDFLLCIAQVSVECLESVLIPFASFHTLAMTYHHPLAVLYEQGAHRAQQLSLSSATIAYSPLLRRNVWRDLGVTNTARRLHYIYQKKERFGFHDNELFDACVDALDFSCSVQDLHVSTQALNFVALILAWSPHPSALDILAQALSLFSFADQVHVLSELIQRLERDDIDVYETESLLYPRFIEFSVSAATRHRNIRTALLHSGFHHFFIFTVSQQLDSAAHKDVLRNHTVLEIVKSVVDDVLPLAQVSNEDRRLWKTVTDIFGWPSTPGSYTDDDWEEVRLPTESSYESIMHPSELTATIIDAQRIDTNPEDTFILWISVKHSKYRRKWEVCKTLSALKELYSEVWRKGRSQGVDREVEERVSQSRIWKQYSTLQPRDKEVLIEELLCGLTRLQYATQCQEVVTFLTTDVVHNAQPREPRRGKATVFEIPILVELDDSFLILEDDNDDKRFHNVGSRLGLL